MEDIQPRHVIDRLENRWASRLQQDAKAWVSNGSGPPNLITFKPTVRGPSQWSSSAPAEQARGRGTPLAVESRPARVLHRSASARAALLWRGPAGALERASLPTM
jgi:hypothetical protein